MYLCIIHNGTGPAQGIPCSREKHCINEFYEDSVRQCCMQEGTLTYRFGMGESCEHCYGMLNIIYKKCRLVIFFAVYSVWMGGRHCSRQ